MIKIVTVYQTLNPGSFLQATSLYNTIHERYDDVLFYNTKARHPLISGIKLSVKLLAKGRIVEAFNQYKMVLQYNSLLRYFNITAEIDENDVYVLGSDEIWNVSRNDFKKYSIFWGEGLKQSKSFSYAPSINNSTEKDLAQCGFVNQSLKSLYRISVRDKHSMQELSKLTNRELTLVCDPVLLRTVDDFKEKYQKKSRDYQFIFVYGPESHFKTEDTVAIKKIAKDYNLKIVSYYFYHDWADYNIYGSPYDFLECIESATYVVTTTFHGTVFSIMYNKEFAVCGSNRKVSEVLSLFDLEHVKTTGIHIKDIIFEKKPYNVINEKIKDFSNRSRKYLFDSLDELVH